MPVSQQPALPSASSSPAGVGFYTGRGPQSSLLFWLMVSMGAHIAFLTLLWIIVILMQFFGFKIPLFDMATKPRDVEFVLVDNSPRQPPRHPTRNRAAHASRSGGQKIANLPTQLSQRAAGRPAPKAVPHPAAQPQPRPHPAPQPSRQATRPSPQPQPRATATPTPTPSQAPAPPAPKLPRPTKIASTAPSLPPSPVAPTIRTPAPRNPSLSGGGPVVKSPGNTPGASGSSGGGSPSSSLISGSPSRGGYSGGGPGGGGPRGGGSGGTGSYNQSGSPGGGGGRNGIDAEEEPDFGPYVAELQRRIRRNWAPPVEDRSKRVVVLFRIARDGRLLNPQIQQSSGSPPADQAALAAVRASAPFKALPPNFHGNDIAVQFVFDYDVAGHGNARMR
jgi:TonB family protein